MKLIPLSPYLWLPTISGWKAPYLMDTMESLDSKNKEVDNFSLHTKKSDVIYDYIKIIFSLTYMQTN